jgi:hypothetical protein
VRRQSASVDGALTSFRNPSLCIAGLTCLCNRSQSGALPRGGIAAAPRAAIVPRWAGRRRLHDASRGSGARGVSAGFGDARSAGSRPGDVRDGIRTAGHSFLPVTPEAGAVGLVVCLVADWSEGGSFGSSEAVELSDAVESVRASGGVVGAGGGGEDRVTGSGSHERYSLVVRILLAAWVRHLYRRSEGLLCKWRRGKDRVTGSGWRECFSLIIRVLTVSAMSQVQSLPPSPIGLRRPASISGDDGVFTRFRNRSQSGVAPAWRDCHRTSGRHSPAVGETTAPPRRSARFGGAGCVRRHWGCAERRVPARRCSRLHPHGWSLLRAGHP